MDFGYGGKLGSNCMRRRTAFAAVTVTVVTSVLAMSGYCEESGMASSQISSEHLRQYSDLAENWMQQYLRVDTTNPPGNEMRGVEFFKKILDDEGVENRVFEVAPGRGDLWARIPANSDSS